MSRFRDPDDSLHEAVYSVAMRIHAFEFTDQEWCPSFVKQGIQDYLDYVSERFGVYDGLAPRLADAARRAGQNRFVEFGSGSGGGMLKLWRSLKQSNPGATIVQSDLSPGMVAPEYAELGITYESAPIDARSVPERLSGFRVLCAVAHHFHAKDLGQVFRHAVESRSGIAVFEPVQRALGQALAMLFVVPWLVLLFTPLLRPRRLTRFFFTYVLPVIPAAIVWDGLVSVLRAYRPEELLAIAAEIDDGRFEWESGVHRAPGKPDVTFLVGVPKQ